MNRVSQQRKSQPTLSFAMNSNHKTAKASPRPGLCPRRHEIHRPESGQY